MFQEMDNDKLLISFLQKLADDLKKGKISQEEKQHIGEFYMSWIFNSGNNNSDDISEQDFMKFLTMGWYVYRQILKGETV